MFDIEKAKAKGIDSQSIDVMEKINENTTKRNSCKMHDFERIDICKYQCKNCGCKERSEYVNGYNDALRHAREL